MSNNKAQLMMQNLQQQTKRLLDQLKELEENKEDFDEEEYNQLKQSSLEQLATFQQSLSSLESDPNNSIFESEIEKTKREILQACKNQFNKDQVVDKILSQQAKGLRHRLAQLEKQHHFKNVSENDYVGRKRRLIVEIEETGAKLTAEEEQWLKLNHHFVDKGTAEEVKAEVQQNQVKMAQKKLEDS